MNVHQLKVGPMENFCYVLSCATNKDAIVIDPGWEHERILAYLNEHELRPVLVISTHAHYDHVQENRLWRQDGVKILAHELAKDALPDITVKDKDTYPFCDETLEFIHAPGHEAGSILIKAGKNLFTGDVLFIGAIGRTDLPTSDKRDMGKTLKMLDGMDDDLILWPGHDYGDVPFRTLGEEKEKNPYLHS